MKRLIVRKVEVSRLMAASLVSAGVPEAEASRIAADVGTSFLSSFLRLIVERKKVALRGIVHGSGRSTSYGDFVHLEVVKSANSKEDSGHGKAWRDFTAGN
jgi:hypothetical protein